MIDPEDLTEGFGKLGASASFAQVSGRGLASGLVAVSGAARAVTADALSYAASVTCLLMVKGDEPRPEGKPAGNRRLRSDITQGLAFITRHPVLRKTIACAATGNLFIAMQISLNLLFLVQVLHMRPAFAGLATALGSLGGIVGGMLAAPMARHIGSARIIWFSLLVLDAPSLVLPLAAPEPARPDERGEPVDNGACRSGAYCGFAYWPSGFALDMDRIRYHGRSFGLLSPLRRSDVRYLNAASAGEADPPRPPHQSLVRHSLAYCRCPRRLRPRRPARRQSRAHPGSLSLASSR